MNPYPPLFFIEEIFRSSEKDGNDTVTLLDAREAETSEESNAFVTRQTSQGQFQFEEGSYVFFSEKEGTYSNGNSDLIAKRNLFLNNRFRSTLAKRIKLDNNPNESIPPITSVYSYHVNVGHGNCSILVLNCSGTFKIWMVDCSNHDFTSGHWHQDNIDQCLDHIKSRFRLSEIRIEKFFLTHSHYDHYSGVPTLISRNCIDSSTTFYINPYYSMPSKKYNNLLTRINRLKCPVIHPNSQSNTAGINFWYPSNILVRSAPKVPPPAPYNIEPNVNNSSAVFKLTFGDKSILFTGDIEHGWNNITQCPTHLGQTTYFIVSHHGSKNGHLRTNCPLHLAISNVGHCKSPNTNSIIMGRDGAYSGIYSAAVITDLSPNVVFTEYDNAGSIASYLEIEWDTNTKIWH